MTFLPPKNAKPAEVERAAKAIEKRCPEYGYKGVTAKVAGSKEAPEVEVACATGITERMKPWLLHFTVNVRSSHPEGMITERLPSTTRLADSSKLHVDVG
jgi:hypothetical protein